MPIIRINVKESVIWSIHIYISFLTLTESLKLPLAFPLHSPSFPLRNDVLSSSPLSFTSFPFPYFFSSSYESFSFTFTLHFFFPSSNFSLSHTSEYSSLHLPFLLFFAPFFLSENSSLILYFLLFFTLFFLFLLYIAPFFLSEYGSTVAEGSRGRYERTSR